MAEIQFLAFPKPKKERKESAFRYNSTMRDKQSMVFNTDVLKAQKPVKKQYVKKCEHKLLENATCCMEGQKRFERSSKSQVKLRQEMKQAQNSKLGQTLANIDPADKKPKQANVQNFQQMTTKLGNPQSQIIKSFGFGPKPVPPKQLSSMAIKGRQSLIFTPLQKIESKATYKSLMTTLMQDNQQKNDLRKSQSKTVIKQNKTFQSSVFSDGFENDQQGRNSNTYNIKKSNKGQQSTVNPLSQNFENFPMPKIKPTKKVGTLKNQPSEGLNQIMKWSETVDTEKGQQYELYAQSRSIGSPIRQQNAMKRNNSNIFSTIQAGGNDRPMSPLKSAKNQSSGMAASIGYANGQNAKWTGPITNRDVNTNNYDNTARLGKNNYKSMKKLNGANITNQRSSNLFSQ